MASVAVEQVIGGMRGIPVGPLLVLVPPLLPRQYCSNSETNGALQHERLSMDQTALLSGVNMLYRYQCHLLWPVLCYMITLLSICFVSA